MTIIITTTRQQTLSELDRIVASPLLTVEQKKKLQDTRKEIIAKSSFGCSAGNCEWSI